jgi:hypothetical protein
MSHIHVLICAIAAAVIAGPAFGEGAAPAREGVALQMAQNETGIKQDTKDAPRRAGHRGRHGPHARHHPMGRRRR